MIFTTRSERSQFCRCSNKFMKLNVNAVDVTGYSNHFTRTHLHKSTYICMYVFIKNKARQLTFYTIQGNNENCIRFCIFIITFDTSRKNQ